MKKRIWLTMLFMFVIGGTISCVFNVLLNGKYPVVQFFIGGFFASVVYWLFTSLLGICKNELKTRSKVFLAFVHSCSMFSTLGCTSLIFAKDIPMWWMYLTWLVVGVLVGYRSYMDAEKVDF